MTIAAVQDCLDLLKKYDVPENIEKHSWKVYEVAMFLGRKLKAKGVRINLNLVAQAALLHDIDKMDSLKGKGKHGALGKKILEKEGLPKIAEIASKHKLQQILKEKPFNSWEERIVYYADKRVLHDKIVPVGRRFNYLKRTYGGKSSKSLETIKKAEPRVRKLENEIFELIGIEKDLKELQ